MHGTRSANLRILHELTANPCELARKSPANSRVFAYGLSYMSPPRSTTGARARAHGSRQLDVLVRWSGGDAAGQSWDDSWIGVTWLTHDQRKVAREMEVEFYKADAPVGQPTGPAMKRPIYRRTSAVYGADN